MNPLLELLDLLIENNHASSNYGTERRLRAIREKLAVCPTCESDDPEVVIVDGERRRQFPWSVCTDPFHGPRSTPDTPGVEPERVTEAEFDERAEALLEATRASWSGGGIMGRRRPAPPVEQREQEDDPRVNWSQGDWLAETERLAGERDEAVARLKALDGDANTRVKQFDAIRELRAALQAASERERQLREWIAKEYSGGEALLDLLDRVEAASEREEELREGLKRLVAACEAPDPEPDERKVDSYGTHACGCSWDSGPYPIPCEKHDPDRILAAEVEQARSLLAPSHPEEGKDG